MVSMTQEQESCYDAPFNPFEELSIKLPPATVTLLAWSNIGTTEPLYRDPEPYVGDDYKLVVSSKDRWKVLGVRSNVEISVTAVMPARCQLSF